MKPSEKRWPAQQAPDDFADRVVQATLRATRANFAELEAPLRRASSRFFGRAALGWRLAAALMVGALALYFGKVRPEAASRNDAAITQLAEARAEATRKAREVVELQAKVAKLEADLLQERMRAELSAKVAAGQHLKAVAPARPATSRPACNCTPGDPLCSCL